MSLGRAMARVGAATALSRLLGFARDLLIAILLGAGPVADAFVIAFRLPNLVRRVFAEGALNGAYVPVSAEVGAREGLEGQRQFASQLLSLLGLGAALLCFVLVMAMPLALHALAPGFAGDAERWDLAVTLTRITTPSLLFLVLLAVFAAVLNGQNRFTESALAPVVMNLLLIGVLIALLSSKGISASLAGYALAVGLTLATIIQTLYVGRAVSRSPLPLTLVRPALSQRVRTFLALLGPSLLVGALAQINALIATIIASSEPSAVSWLYYADRLYQLPLSIVGIAMSVVLMPALVSAVESGDETKTHETQDSALLGALALSLPAAIGLAVLARPIVAVLFEHGAFSTRDGDATALALAFFAFGLPPFALAKVFAPAFFARRQGRAPLILALISLGVTLALSLALFRPMGHGGLALAATVSAYAYAVSLGRAAAREGHMRFSPAVGWMALRVVMANLLMAAALFAMDRLSAMPLPALTQSLRLFALIGGTLLVYGAALKLVGAGAILRMMLVRSAAPS
jgi:putative peptidoglycan lipid II flippase